jgi:hypothetical protein
MALAPLAPEEAEAIALQLVSDEFEYTRLAALHVLEVVNSPHLRRILDQFKDDPSAVVRNRSVEIAASRPPLAG